MEFLDELIMITGSDNVLVDVPMSEHTSFKAGGPADYYVTPGEAGQLVEVIKLCRHKDVKYHIHGNGSNVLFLDEGYRGVVISIGHNMSDVNVDGNVVTAQAGISLAKLANVAADAGLSGLEFASGIPGLLGGGITMNAGAYGGEIKDVIITALVYNNDKIISLNRDELELSYRKSVIQDKNYVVLEACFKLQYAPIAEIKAKMKDYNQRRRDKQPLEYGSAGSTFKRPEGCFAGKLIEDSGLKGFKIGDAMVSEKHAGFVVNIGNAASADIMNVIRHVQDEVYNKHGVVLETEVKLIT